MEKHLHFWKHNLIVYSPFIVFSLTFPILGGNTEFVGEIIGRSAILLIIMNFVFKPFNDGESRSDEKVKGYIISSIIGIVVISNATNFNLLVIILSLITFYLSKFKKFTPIKN